MKEVLITGLAFVGLFGMTYCGDSKKQFISVFGFKDFTACKGKQNDFSDYISDAMVAHDKCKEHAENKYCLYQCVGEYMGFLDDEGTLNEEKSEKSLKEVVSKKSRKEKVWAAIKKCYKKPLGEIKGKCKKSKKAFKCFQKKYKKIC